MPAERSYAAGSALAKFLVGAIAPGSNPFSNVYWYVPTSWQKEVYSSIAQYVSNSTGQFDHIQSVVAFQQPVAVWIATNESADDLKRVLKDASKEGRKGDVPTLVQLIVYNLPDRDCSAASSEVARLIHKYADLRFAVINVGNPASKCAQAPYAHIELLQYAITNFQAANTAVYLYSGHGGWLRWPDNQAAAAKLVSEIVGGIPKPARLRGLSRSCVDTMFEIQSSREWPLNTFAWFIKEERQS
ncbi:hypothetical protein HK097_003679 [Rhizophlyctis rosea]|uniref:Glucanase n=1 Tax=Rhizophlyctis rosea TaxID=64517 RepID=A0AAD5SFS7_9FUNG|nr:hypothetical protein HK097_003679 [Rhizophlyctis rosea]